MTQSRTKHFGAGAGFGCKPFFSFYLSVKKNIEKNERLTAG